MIISWDYPNLFPYFFELSLECQYFFKSERFRTEHKIISGATNKVHINALSPSVLCIVRLIAVFNPAKFDPGVINVFETLPLCKLFNLYVLYVLC